MPGGHNDPDAMTDTAADPCDGPLMSGDTWDDMAPLETCDDPSSPKILTSTPCRDVFFSTPTSDRAELIERIKRGESPTWVSNHHLRHLKQIQSKLNRTPSPHPTHSPQTLPLFSSSTPQTIPRPSDSPSLLPAAEILSDPLPHNLSPASSPELGRPRSANHAGDFTASYDLRRQSLSQLQGDEEDRFPHSKASLLRSFTQDWAPKPQQTHQHQQPRIGVDVPTPPQQDRHPPVSFSSNGMRQLLTSGPSVLASSLSSLSPLYRAAPTSPLVQSTVNEDVASLPVDLPDHHRLNTRRYTMNSVLPSSPSPFGSAPCRAHQPRVASISLSFSDAMLPSSSSSQLRSPRLRRPSHSADASLSSSLHHASMVGSYEESILRGRMSSTPSWPLEFLAQIGVLGLGKCKSSLRCPSHVTLPFHAVFYHYSAGGGRSSEGDGPSPYVGLIDLENGLANQEEALRARRKLHVRTAADRERKLSEGDDMNGHGSNSTATGSIINNSNNNNDNNNSSSSSSNNNNISRNSSLAPATQDRRLSLRHKRTLSSAKSPPGGSYRIPEKGQLQIIIKNQNKTAVKLFLVPYDLSGMEPGTKTFIRQRSYSVVPAALSPSSSCSPTPSPSSPSSGERNILRYLVHLHICCPSRGRYYLYKGIRVVFANRVPDGKELLRNETTWPDPRFTPYSGSRLGPSPIQGDESPMGLFSGGRDFPVSLGS